MKNKLKNVRNWIYLRNKELQAAFVTSMLMPLQAGATNANTNTTQSIMKNALDVVFQIFMYVGIFVAIFGVVNLINSIQQQDGDRQQKAVGGIVIGGVMIGLKFFVAAIINNAGTGITL